MKRNSLDVGKNTKQPKTTIISPNLLPNGHSNPAEVPRLSVYRRSFDGRQQTDYELSKSQEIQKGVKEPANVIIGSEQIET